MVPPTILIDKMNPLNKCPPRLFVLCKYTLRPTGAVDGKRFEMLLYLVSIDVLRVKFVNCAHFTSRQLKNIIKQKEFEVCLTVNLSVCMPKDCTLTIIPILLFFTVKLVQERF